MIYYYFKSKERLYLAVLESVYEGIRESERALDLEHASPLEGMQRLVHSQSTIIRGTPIS